MILISTPKYRDGGAEIDAQPAFLTDCLTWCIRDTGFILSLGDGAIVTQVLTDISGFTDGQTITIAGNVLTVDNSLSAGDYDFATLTFSGNGTRTDINEAIADLVSDIYGADVTTAVTAGAGTSTLEITWNILESLPNFINTTIAPNTIVGVNGNGPVYSNSRIKAVLLKDGEVVPNSQQFIYTQLRDPITVEDSCFDFGQAIADSLANDCPNIGDGAGISEVYFSPDQMAGFRVRYSREEPDASGKYQQVSNSFTTNELIVISGVQELDDSNARVFFTTGDVSKFLNDHQTKCVGGNDAWIAFPTWVRSVSAALGLDVRYYVRYKRPGGEVTSVIPSLDNAPYGIAYVDMGNFPGVQEGDLLGIKVYSRLFFAGTSTPAGDLVAITEEYQFTYKTCCKEVEIYWREPHGVCSTMVIQHERERGVATEGESECLSELCGLEQKDNLNRGHKFIFNKKATQSFKVRDIIPYCERDARRYTQFLASDYYAVKAKDNNGNELMRRIIPTYGELSYYKQGELMKLEFSYKYASEEQTVTNHY